MKYSITIKDDLNDQCQPKVTSSAAGVQVKVSLMFNRPARSVLESLLSAGFRRSQPQQIRNRPLRVVQRQRQALRLASLHLVLHPLLFQFPLWSFPATPRKQKVWKENAFMSTTLLILTSRTSRFSSS